MSATRHHRSSSLFGLRVAVSFGAMVLLGWTLAFAQGPTPLDRAKALYHDAAYEEALGALRDADSAEAHEYRALCLMALGRTAEAEKALESLVMMAPTYVPSETDVPPRLLSLLNQTRSRVMPAVLRQLFTDARALFQAKEYQKAGDAFERLLEISNDPVLEDSEHAEDLRLLIGGFIDLVNATPVSPTPPAPASPSAEPPAARPAAAAADAATAPALPPEVVPAVTIRQDIPSWTGRVRTSTAPTTAVMRITIGVDGTVQEAVIERSIDPAYDAKLLLAARSWLYQPARLRGKPVASSKQIEVTLAR